MDAGHLSKEKEEIPYLTVTLNLFYLRFYGL